MRKINKIPAQRLMNYTELLYKLKVFSAKDKNEILNKLNKNQ